MRIVGATTVAALLASVAFAVACDRSPRGVAQYGYEAGYGMPNPQPGSPISDAGVAPAPSPTTPSPAPSRSPGTPAPGTPVPGTPAPAPAPAPGYPTPSPTNP
jgi:hypothetical protein